MWRQRGNYSKSKGVTRGKIAIKQNWGLNWQLILKDYFGGKKRDQEGTVMMNLSQGPEKMIGRVIGDYKA